LETPSLRRRWEEYRPTKTQAFWFAVGAIVVILIIGFGPGGWVTARTAQAMVADSARNSRQQLASAVCVEEFMDTANTGTRLEQIRKASWLDRASLVAEWATMPGESEPSSVVANMCASALAKLEVPASAAAKPVPIGSAKAK